MLGHKLALTYRETYDTWVTFRGSAADYARCNLAEPARTLGGVDVAHWDSVVEAFARARPEVVINCVGIIKQLPTANDPIPSLTINALLPHRLAVLARVAGARLIHISTDCVFSGRKGNYTEADVSDAEDLYGRTKFLGEVSGEGVLTLRTSIIGRELGTASGLVEWFLSQAGRRVRGFRRAIYSGFTTLELARIMARLIDDWPELSGLWQVSAEPINKFDLLCMLREAYGVAVEIEPDDGVDIDRSLDSRRFREATGYTPPDWPTMVAELAGDKTPYLEWRRGV